MSKAQVHKREFDSLDEFVEAASSKASKHWTRSRASQDTDDPEWAGSKTYQDAVKVARDGWTKGRKLVHASLSEILESGAAQEADADCRDYEVAGFLPNVPLACAGELECMYDLGEDDTASQPILRIWVMINVNCNVSAKAMTNRAAAVCALVSELEAAGQSLEVSALFTCRNRETDSKFQYIINLKRAGEILTIDDIAFGLGHPAMTRRLGFSMMEVDDWVAGHGSDKNAYHYGYGYAASLSASEIPHDVIYLREITGHNESAYRTPEKAMAYVRRLFEIEQDAKLQDA